jgi:hypothetical protein
VAVSDDAYASVRRRLHSSLESMLGRGTPLWPTRWPGLSPRAAERKACDGAVAAGNEQTDAARCRRPVHRPARAWLPTALVSCSRRRRGRPGQAGERKRPVPNLDAQKRLVWNDSDHVTDVGRGPGQLAGSVPGPAARPDCGPTACFESPPKLRLSRSYKRPRDGPRSSRLCPEAPRHIPHCPSRGEAQARRSQRGPSVGACSRAMALLTESRSTVAGQWRKQKPGSPSARCRLCSGREGSSRLLDRAESRRLARAA